MHELSIALSIVDQVSAELPADNEDTVSAVHLQLGQLSGVDKAALLFCYSAACEGTPLEGSRLVIEDVPVTLHCEVCSMESSPPSLQQLMCPICRGQAEVLRGYELDIVRMELTA